MNTAGNRAHPMERGSVSRGTWAPQEAPELSQCVLAGEAAAGRRPALRGRVLMRPAQAAPSDLIRLFGQVIQDLYFTWLPCS